MKNSINFFCCGFLSLLLCLCFAANSSAQGGAQKIPAEVQSIAGTYAGSWTSYGINDKGEVIKQAAWTDTLKAENPTLAADRAFVSVTDAMTFEGGRIPPMSITGKEGYLLNKDGMPGDYYIEMFGQTTRPQKLDKETWVYLVPANAREFTALGDKFISANHVMVKTITFEQGVETHHITRLTTVRWNDADGKERSTQFVSLQGQHKRTK